MSYRMLSSRLLLPTLLLTLTVGGLPIAGLGTHACAVEPAAMVAETAPKTVAKPKIETTTEAVTETAAPAAKWRTLFNGKDLTGWTAKIRGHKSGENFGNTFRVEEGLLKVAYDQYGGKFKNRFGHLFFNETFSHYRLRVEYRVVGKQLPGGPGWAAMNSGLMVHGQSPESMALGQKFPVSIEVQLLSRVNKRPRPTANLCTPGTHVVMNGKLFTPHCMNSTSPTIPVGEWATAEVEVHGAGKIIHRVNGKSVLEYEQPQYDPDDKEAQPLIKKNGGKLLIQHGTISLQSESHPMEFRKVEILVLKK